MKYFFHTAAEVELSAAVDFYELQQPSLGRHLSEEIQTAIQQICAPPLAWEKLDSKTHRFLTNQFPYGILYRVKEDHIRIIASMHLRRKPEYWHNR